MNFDELWECKITVLLSGGNAANQRSRDLACVPSCQLYVQEVNLATYKTKVVFPPFSSY